MLRPGIVVLVEEDHEIAPAMVRTVVRLDDAYWRRQVRAPFTWQRYVDWWAARRWVDRNADLGGTLPWDRWGRRDR